MARQTEIEDTERKVNKRIENHMHTLSDLKKKKTRANNAHKDGEATTIAAMRDEGLTEYTSVDLGLTIELDDTAKVKLSAYHPPEAEKAKSKKPEAEA